MSEAKPSIRRDGTVWLNGRYIGLTFKTDAGEYIAIPPLDASPKCKFRRDAVAALVRANEGTTDGE